MTSPTVECYRCGLHRTLEQAGSEGWAVTAWYHGPTDTTELGYVCGPCRTPEEVAEGALRDAFPEEEDAAILAAAERLVSPPIPPPADPRWRS